MPSRARDRTGKNRRRRAPHVAPRKIGDGLKPDHAARAVTTLAVEVMPVADPRSFNPVLARKNLIARTVLVAKRNRQ